MAENKLVIQRTEVRRYVPAVLTAALLTAGIATFPWWMPSLQSWLTPVTNNEADSHSGHAHNEHDHGNAANENWLELSPQARANIGLKTDVVKIRNEFYREITVPGMIVERKGRSRMEVTAPLTGVVTRIFPLEGESLSPGAPLFTIRLTHEELVSAQAELLRTSDELDVIRQEVARIEGVAKDGGIAGKSLLERKYELQKQEAHLRSLRQALLLHGLNDEQIDTILTSHKLLGELTVSIPSIPELPMAIMQVQAVRVEHGQHVEAGATLAILSNHAEMIIEGEAFERDAGSISSAMTDGLPITAVFDVQGTESETIPRLTIQYVDSRIEDATRSLHFYVPLKNELRNDSRVESSHRFVDWRYKPGQRVQLRVPVEKWNDKIVIPIDGIAQEGVETYAFRVNGRRLERQSVRVEFRDPLNAVIANDGSLFPGETIAISAAHQIQLAIKNKSGGAVDPHAGHSH